ncbi:myosin regulatory light chain 2 isoform X3 [Hyalella azteca]|uniref:Myosin regulatory light chain 2 isoform X3 n=1 Tax=Hyalella azteca TaxID=294128 RepID=A0A8B7NGT2_HYAAZ|nr:myosin regulatory light chain 2 isoform X3 [Hyalella azteca]
MPEAPAPTPAASKKKKDKKKASKGGGGGSNVFDQFSQKQVAEFKEGFQFMDRDKDGIIGRGDIRATADEVGVNLSEQQIDQMLADCAASINFTQLINMFGTRQQGGATDEDEVIVAAFKAFADEDGKIECDSIKTALMTYGDKYSDDDIKNFFGLVPIEDGKFPAKYVSDLLTGKLKDD